MRSRNNPNTANKDKMYQSECRFGGDIAHNTVPTMPDQPFTICTLSDESSNKSQSELIDSPPKVSLKGIVEQRFEQDNLSKIKKLFSISSSDHNEKIRIRRNKT